MICGLIILAISFGAVWVHFSHYHYHRKHFLQRQTQALNVMQILLQSALDQGDHAGAQQIIRHWAKYDPDISRIRLTVDTGPVLAQYQRDKAAEYPIVSRTRIQYGQNNASLILEKDFAEPFKELTYLGLQLTFGVLAFTTISILFTLQLRRNQRQIQLTDEARQAVAASEQLLQHVLASADIGYWDWQYQTGQHTVSDRWLEILDLERKDLQNTINDWRERVHPDDLAAAELGVKTAIEQQRPYRMEFRMRHKDGHWVWIHGSGIVAERDERGQPLRFCGAHRDISEQKRQLDLIEHQAYYDTLTHLPNRLLCLDRLQQGVRESNRSGHLLAVLFVDLDDFKKINDTLGHTFGDYLLIAAADRLRKEVREVDTVGRLGGDEFLVLLPGIRDINQIRLVAENLLKRFREPFLLNERRVMLSASIGIAICPNDGQEAGHLLRLADTAMYHSKDEGRNAYHFFTQSMNKDVAQRLVLEEQLHDALAKNEFSLHYQPLVSLSDGLILGAEALLRWHNPVLGQVPPDTFIPITENNGQIISIGHFVLDQALSQAIRWRDQLGRPFRIAANLSPRQFREVSLHQQIAELLQHHRLAAENLELEITEGVLMQQQEPILNNLDALSRLGVNLSMDDFGTGYSSLSYLRQYPFDTLKIDRTFINDLFDDSSNSVLVNATIQLAHNLGLKVIGEGIETREQLAILQQKGCDIGQGYLFGHPLPADKFEDLLRKDNGKVSL